MYECGSNHGRHSCEDQKTKSGGDSTRRQISEFEASLVYRVSPRTARATQRNPVSKKTKKIQHRNPGNTKSVWQARRLLRSTDPCPDTSSCCVPMADGTLELSGSLF